MANNEIYLSFTYSLSARTTLKLKIFGEPPTDEELEFLSQCLTRAGKQIKDRIRGANPERREVREL